MQPINLLDYEALAQQRMAHIPWEYYQGSSEDLHLLVFFALTEFHHVQARAKQEGRQFDVAAHLFAGRMSFSDHACSSYE